MGDFDGKCREIYGNIPYMDGMGYGGGAPQSIRISPGIPATVQSHLSTIAFQLPNFPVFRKMLLGDRVGEIWLLNRS